MSSQKKCVMQNVIGVKKNNNSIKHNMTREKKIKWNYIFDTNKQIHTHEKIRWLLFQTVLTSLNNLSYTHLLSRKKLVFVALPSDGLVIESVVGSLLFWLCVYHKWQWHCQMMFWAYRIMLFAHLYSFTKTK